MKEKEREAKRKEGDDNSTGGERERERDGGEKEAVKGVIGRGKSSVETIVGCLL